MASWLIVVLLRAFSAHLDFPEALSGLLPVRRNLRFTLFGGVDFLYGRALSALCGVRLFLSGVLRGLRDALALGF